MQFNEDQLVDLQTRLAYQEDTLSRLNEVVTAQQAELDRLRGVLGELLRTLGDGGAGGALAGPAGGEEKPPHY